MDKQFLLRWVNALNSGQYAQGVGQLRDRDNNYCCLGVACDLLIQEGRLRPWVFSRTHLSYIVGDDYWSFIPVEAAVEIGIGINGHFEGQGPLIYNGDVYTDISIANDNGVPFGVIAEYIRKAIKQ